MVLEAILPKAAVTGPEVRMKTGMQGRANNPGAMRACKGFDVVDLLGCDSAKHPAAAG
jgi:hypothetical protein